MSAELEPEEVQAILEPSEAAPTAGAELELRDFSRPLRLGPRGLEALAGNLRAASLDIAQRLRAQLPTIGEVELVDVTEVACNNLFADLEEPFCMVEFEVDGQPGWILWELEAALRAIEVLLGTAEPPEEVQPRTLTPVEERVALRLLTTLCESVCTVIGVSPKAFRAVRRKELVTEWSSVGESADPARAAVRLELREGEHQSGVRLYVPGIAPGDESDAQRPTLTPLPEHLRDVQLELVGYLASIDVPLAQLLTLEIGDVIPLRIPRSSPVRLHAEDRAWAEARLGTVCGQLGLSIERMLPAADEVTP